VHYGVIQPLLSPGCKYKWCYSIVIRFTSRDDRTALPLAKGCLVLFRSGCFDTISTAPSRAIVGFKYLRGTKNRHILQALYCYVLLLDHAAGRELRPQFEDQHLITSFCYSY
jgi:hypothetical protein